MVSIKNFALLGPLLFMLFFKWKLADGQTIVMSAPGTAEVNTPLTLMCTYTPTAGQSVTGHKWTYTSASTVLTLDSSCNVAFGGSTITVTYTKTCTGNTFTLNFPAASIETINREWCCNVAVDTGSAPTDPGDCKTIDLDCGSLTNPSGGTVSTPTTTKDSVATYTCNDGYTMGGSNTRTCQQDGTWSGSAPTCTGTTTTTSTTTTTTPGTTEINTTSGPTNHTTSGTSNHTEGSTTNSTISSTTASSSSLPVSVIMAISAGGGLVILVGITIAITCYCKRKSKIKETIDDKHSSGIDNHGIYLQEHSNRDHHL